MNGKEKIIILFDGPHLAYSPTTIQLYDELSKKYEVLIIAQDHNNFVGQELNDRNVIYHKYYNEERPKLYKRLFRYLKRISSRMQEFEKNGLTYRDYFYKYLLIKRTIRKNKFKRVICIDNVNLYYCSLLKQPVDFLSLEIAKDEHLLTKINRRIINCVIIQSTERYNYLFKEEKYKTFFVQNAPVYLERQLKEKRKNLIYAGSSNEGFGFYKCLDFLNRYPDETLTVQGALLEADRKKVHDDYNNLLEENRLLFNNKYLDNDDVVDFISDYEIGFCFYDFNFPTIKANYFNYFTAPSGKLFKYLAAGVPVVCINIAGFKFVQEFQCGILIDTLSEDDIRNAILTIRKNYSLFVDNSIKAAKHFSFDKAILPYLEFIEK